MGAGKYIYAGEEKVFDFFREISAIPRPSGEEEKIADYLVNHGKRLGLEIYRDENNNVILRRKDEHTDSMPVTLQAHMDMVWEAKGGDGGLDKTPRGIHEKDGWLTASGTTLGADNGIGMALILALLENAREYPPLEAVFTSNEEETMGGAAALSGEELRGSSLINLDSEKEGVFTIGAAGGISAVLEFPAAMTEALKDKAVTVCVKGGRGGHSGLDIGRQRENAIALLIRFLRTLDVDSWELISLKGGSRSNAIPSEAEALIRTDCIDDIKNLAEIFMERCREEWLDEEEELVLTAEAAGEAMKADVYREECRERLLLLLETLPHGVKNRTGEYISSSVNLAVVDTDSQKAETVTVELSLRSLYESWYHDEVKRICRLGEYLGAGVSIQDEYPAWAYKTDSGLIKLLTETYKKTFGCEAALEHVHAGVECGLLMENCSSIREAVSIGPTIINAHTVDEAVEVESVKKVFWFLDAVLKQIKQISCKEETFDE